MANHLAEWSAYTLNTWNTINLLELPANSAFILPDLPSIDLRLCSYFKSKDGLILLTMSCFLNPLFWLEISYKSCPWITLCLVLSWSGSLDGSESFSWIRSLVINFLQFKHLKYQSAFFEILVWSLWKGEASLESFFSCILGDIAFLDVLWNPVWGLWNSDSLLNG